MGKAQSHIRVFKVDKSFLKNVIIKRLRRKHKGKRIGEAQAIHIILNKFRKRKIGKRKR